MEKYLQKIKTGKVLAIAVGISIVLVTLFVMFKGNNLFGFSKSNSISIQETAVDENYLEVKVVANDIKDELLGVAFNLEFDEENLRYESYAYGNFFEQSGEPIYLCSMKKGFDGLLVCGITLRREQNLVLGSGNIVSFYFEILSDDKDWEKFNFINSYASTLKDGERFDIEDIQFID